MPNAYDQKKVIRCTGTWERGGEGVDPTTVIFKYKNPAGTITTLTYGVDAEVVKSATGVYYVDVDGDTSGTWFYRFESTGTGKSGEEDSFVIRASEFD